MFIFDSIVLDSLATDCILERSTNHAKLESALSDIVTHVPQRQILIQAIHDVWDIQCTVVPMDMRDPIILDCIAVDCN